MLDKRVSSMKMGHHKIGSIFQVLTVVLCFVQYFEYANGELTPPYFNLAEGRKIYASSTCGVGTDSPELYCKLVGANTENDPYFSVIQGQVYLINFVYMYLCNTY